jgi:hypothetical protein
MTPKFYNNLLYYCLSIRDTAESAETLAQEFLIKFNNLSNWDQVYMSLVIDTEGFEKAFEEIENL